jgi:hypothetical protein
MDAVRKAQGENIEKAVAKFREEYQPLGKLYGWHIGAGPKYLPDGSYQISAKITDDKIFRWSTLKSYEQFKKLLPEIYTFKEGENTTIYPVDAKLTIEGKFLKK